LEFVFVAKDVVLNDPGGPILPAEQAALDHLGAWNVIWGETRKDALSRLRRLLHENLIIFDAADQTEPALPKRLPHTIDAAEVRVALFAKEKDAPPLPFTVVDRIHLANARRVERKRFLFEAPEWHHVVHGTDEQLKFIERDQTAVLVQAVRERLIAPLRRANPPSSAASSRNWWKREKSRWPMPGTISPTSSRAVSSFTFSRSRSSPNKAVQFSCY
jgi:hypothetical protein